MKRADALTPAGEYEEGFGILDEERVKSFVLQWRGYPIEPKPESFGVLSGRIVAIDYGDDLARRASGLTDWEPKA